MLYKIVFMLMIVCNIPLLGMDVAIPLEDQPLILHCPTCNERLAEGVSEHHACQGLEEDTPWCTQKKRELHYFCNQEDCSDACNKRLALVSIVSTLTICGIYAILALVN